MATYTNVGGVLECVGTGITSANIHSAIQSDPTLGTSTENTTGAKHVYSFDCDIRIGNSGSTGTSSSWDASNQLISINCTTFEIYGQFLMGNKSTGYSQSGGALVVKTSANDNFKLLQNGILKIYGSFVYSFWRVYAESSNTWVTEDCDLELEDSVSVAGTGSSISYKDSRIHNTSSVGVKYYGDSSHTFDLTNVKVQKCQYALQLDSNVKSVENVELDSCNYHTVPNVGNSDITFINPDFLDYRPAGANVYDLAAIEFNFELTLLDEVGNAIQDVRVYLEDGQGSQRLNALTNVDGHPTGLTTFQHSTWIGATKTDRASHILRSRKYGKYYFSGARTAVANSNESIRLNDNPNTTLTEASAYAQTGISIDGVAKTITITDSTLTASNIYDYAQAWAVQPVNMQYDEPLSTLNGESFTMPTGWVMVISNSIQGGITITGDVKLLSNVSLTSHNISGTLTFTVSGTYLINESSITEVVNTSGGAVTLNTNGGLNVTTNTGPNITINIPVIYTGISFTGLQSGSQVRIYTTGTTSYVANNDSTGTSYDWNPEYVSDQIVDYTIYKANYVPIRVTGVTLGNTITNVAVQQKVDRAYQSGVTFVYGTDGDYTVNTFNVSKIMTVQQYYSAMIDAWIAQATLKNTRFPITPNGGNSFSFDDCTINESQFETKLYRDGVRVTSGGVVTDMWAAIWTNLPSSDTAEIQQISGASFTDIPQVGIRKGWNAPSGTQSGTVDMLLKIYGGSGTLDYTDYLVIEYAVAGKYQGRVVAHDTYSPLQDELYVLPVAPTIAPIPDTDPALVNPPTIEFASNGTPVSWKGYNWYITIKDSAVGNSGADIANWFNYHIREQNDSLFEGKDPFNYWDCIRDNGAKWKTIRGILWGDYGDTEVGVRVVDTNYEPHPDFNSMIANDGSEYVPPVLSLMTINNLPNNGTQRLRIYNNTKNNEVANLSSIGTTYNQSYTDGDINFASSGDSLTIWFTELYTDATPTNTLKYFKTPITVSDGGFTIDANDYLQSDSVYEINNISGASQDGIFSPSYDADGEKDYIVMDTNTDFSVVGMYAYYCYLLNTQQGIYELWDGITAIDTANYRNNTSVVEILLDESLGFVKQTDSARYFRDDDTRPAIDPTTGGNGIEVNWRNPVFAYDGGGGGFTATDRANIAAIDSKVVVVDNVVDSNAVNISAIKAKTDSLTFTTPNKIDTDVDLSGIDTKLDTNNAKATSIESKLDGAIVTIDLTKVDTAFIKAIEGGRWKIDTALNQMVFYDDDNTTEIARYDLKDADGNPVSDSVYERIKV